MNRHQTDRLAFAAAVFIGILVVMNAALASGQPKIKFKETTWNFGKVKQGYVLSH